MAIIAGPFGLFGFALSTILLNCANAKIFPLNSMNLAMALALGCGLQAVGALIALFQGHFLGAVAFFGYAFFWMSWALIFILQPMVPSLPPPTPLALGMFLSVWLIFTIAMTVAIWRPKSSWALRFTFLTVIVLLVLLAIADFLKAADLKEAGGTVNVIAGISGMVCGFSALYTAIAEVLNPTYGRTILPLGEIDAPPVKAALTEIRTGPSGAGDPAGVPLVTFPKA